MLIRRGGLRAFRLYPSSGIVLGHATTVIRSALSRVQASQISSTPLNQPLRLLQCITQAVQGQRNFATARSSSSSAQKTTASKKQPTRSKSGRSSSTKAKGRSKAKAKSKTKSKAKSLPKRKPKKTLTEEEKTKETIRELRKVALRPPGGLPSTAYLAVASEDGKESKGITGKASSERYKSLSPEELEHYNHIANQNKTKNQEAYAKWVQTFSADQIRAANRARNRLAKLGVKGFSRKIQDPRQVKTAPSARSLFLKERYESGDMRGLKIGDATKIITREWSELPASQKERFEQAHQSDKQRYVREFKDVYGREPPSTNSKTRAATA